MLTVWTKTPNQAAGCTMQLPAKGRELNPNEKAERVATRQSVMKAFARAKSFLVLNPRAFV
jgi:hypothetical protein